MTPRVWLAVMLLLGGALRAETLPDEGRLDELVLRLGAEPHAARQEAFETLSAYSARFPRYMLLALADRYQETRDLEVRFRLEALLTPLAGRYLFGLPPGFIGINMEWSADGEGKAGIRVVSVLAGHAGEAAGLRAGDLIVGVEEDSVDALGSMQAFSERIAGVPPGTILRFDVTRGGEALRIQFPLDSRPGHLEGAGNERPARVEAWLRELSGRGEPEDPTFPVGHFPREEEGGE
ncbi:MAG: PDZ domain-containing protein [Verrucomicrobia bacterium]|nr:PDZ domain-containing protein [Verrucomicrobiota bacterium]